MDGKRGGWEGKGWEGKGGRMEKEGKEEEESEESAVRDPSRLLLLSHLLLLPRCMSPR